MSQLQSVFDLGQQIIVAESDGVVGQGRVVSTGTTPVDIDPVHAAPVLPEAVLSGLASSPAAADVDELVTNTILRGLCQSLKIAADSIDHRKPFSDHGLDSILGVSFVKHLNDRLGINLNTAILFDHTSVDRLARHLVRTHGDLIKVSDATAATVPVPQQDACSTAPAAQTRERQTSAFTRHQERRRRVGADQRLDTMDDGIGIAVIGMSGQFPDAVNVDLFWQNLITGSTVFTSCRVATSTRISTTTL